MLRMQRMKWPGQQRMNTAKLAQNIGTVKPFYKD